MRIILSITAAVFAFGNAAHADIFQWEYINPADPSQGKRQSATLAPDGAGVDAVPGADFSNRNLTMAYLIGANLSVPIYGGDFGYPSYVLAANFAGTNLSRADLTDAHLAAATLTSANFADAEVRGANFERLLVNSAFGGDFHPFLTGTGVTPAQLYATASFHSADLSGTNFAFNDLAGANFASQNLTKASFYDATLTDTDFSQANLTNANFSFAGTMNADFTDAEVRGAAFENAITLAQLYSTASYQAQDLSGIDLARTNLPGGNFAGQNLSNVSFRYAVLTDGDFTDAEVRGASFWRHPGFGEGGISLAQLYSTASYQARDLSGVGLDYCNLAGGNLAGQNLTNASFNGAMLTGADFTAADARDAILFQSDVITTNLIRPDGHINGLNLEAGGVLVVRDYDGNPVAYPVPTGPISISVDQHLAMDPGGTLRMVFEADAWDSTISLAPGIPVTPGGTLELTFAADVNPASQLGRTFDLFNWTGVTPTGAFAISSPYHWNLSNLYSTGEITLNAVPEAATVPLLLASGIAIIISRRSRITR
jgi:uncharacterized protein YjbI with pentapeptide repeats